MWAHQAAEKSIKALLVARDIDPPKRHDLHRPVASLPADDAEVFAVLDLSELSRWAIEGRYPDDFDEATERQADRAITVARAVLAAVRDFSNECSRDDYP